MEVLQLDMSGRPQAWISAREAAIIYASDGIAWTLGDTFFVLRGGSALVAGMSCIEECSVSVTDVGSAKIARSFYFAHICAAAERRQSDFLGGLA